MEQKEFLVNESDANLRVDVFLAKCFMDRSRSFIQGLSEKGNVRVNGFEKKSSYRLNFGDKVSISIPDPVSLDVKAEKIPLDVVYEDKDLIVVNKPQGMVVHPAVGNFEGTLVNALLNHCNDLSGINGVARPGIVHRIDKDTSGLLVVAKNDFSHNKLSEQLKNHSMTRAYYAVVEGKIKAEEGTIDANLARDTKNRLKFAVVKDGRRAITHYSVVERYMSNTFVRCNLETGRTHQIRVHMSHIGHPLVGDPVYGFKKQKFNLQGQLLHAYLLGFLHPVTNEYMEFQSPLPDYFEKILSILRCDSNT